MTEKEKVTALLNMGFTTEEALALATGKYRTVPEPKEKPETKEDKTEQVKVPEPVQKEDIKQNEELSQVLSSFGEQLSKQITEGIIKSNIINIQQPAKQTVEDVLALMLEPNKPEMGVK